MSTRKQELLKCCLRALGAFAVVSVGFLCFVALGISNSSREIGEFATRLIVSDLAIFGFSAVYGFSFLILGGEKLSGSAKRFLHILVNYIAFLLCSTALFANVGEAGIGQWTIFLFFMSVMYFAVYGIASLIFFLIRRKR